MEMETAAAGHLIHALGKIGYGVLGYAVVVGMFTAAARLGHKTMSPNLDEANAIVQEAVNAKPTAAAVTVARYELAGQILRNSTMRQIVAVVLGVVCAIML